MTWEENKNLKLKNIKLRLKTIKKRVPDLVLLWCPEPESNQRHEDFQSSALPTELSGQVNGGPSGT